MTKLYSVVILMFLATISALQAQVNVTSVDQTYTQNFNSLADTGTAPKSFNLANWQISTPDYRVSNGSVNTGTVYSFGAAGSSDRGLGAVTSGSTSNISFGTSFKNEAGAALNEVTLAFKGEQWRRSNKALSGTFVGDTLVFQYSTNATSVADQDADWTTVNALEFVSPVIMDGTNAGLALDGNEDANSESLSATLNINLPAGSTFFIRWNYVRNTGGGLAGSRDGLGIDDLTVTFGEGGEVPVDPCDFDEAAFTEITSIENDLESFKIDFTPVEGATGYLILLDLYNPEFDDYQDYLFPDNKTIYEVGNVIEDEWGEVLVIGKTTLTSFEYTDLDVNEGYYVRVIPYYECDESVYYGDFNEKYFSTVENTCDGAFLIAPKSSNVLVSGTDATLTFSSVEGAVGYIVFIDDADVVDAEGALYDWGIPEDGETYNAGESVGMSTVAYVGSNTVVNINDLGNNKLYYISIHPIFECDEINTYGHYTENEIQTSLPTAIKNKKVSNVLIYPNPVSGNVLNVRLDAAAQGKANVQIFNVLGAQVYSTRQSISSNTQLTLPNQLPSGRYTLRIEQEGTAQIGSFVVVR